MEHRPRSLIGPLVLITAGVLFLLANLGALPFTFWEIAARLWPLLLILIGLDIIIGRRSIIGSVIILVLWVALVGGILWLASAQGAGLLPTANLTTDEIVQPLGDIQSASIGLNGGIATTTVTALDTDSGDLLRGAFRHTQGATLAKTYNVVATEGRLTLSEQGSSTVFWMPLENRWDLRLNPGLPLALRVNGGVGRVSLDLKALNVTSLLLDTGIGTLDVTTPSTGTVTLRLNGGIGSARITIPTGVGARIQSQGGLGALRVDTLRFPKFGEVYQSTDYASAANKIDVEIDRGLGAVTVR